MNILGINQVPGLTFWAHDSAAALVKNGKIVASAEEERFTRVRHQKGYPSEAIQYCLREGNIAKDDVDVIAISYNPWKPFRYFVTYFSPRTLFFSIANLVVFRLFRGRARREFPRARIMYVEHHLAHAGSTYLYSGFSEANILIVDGAGETETFSFFIGKGGKIKKIWEIPLLSIGSYRNKNSIGLVYSRVTNFLNLGTHGEGKTMGLASYGAPAYDFSEILSIRNHRAYTIDRRKVDTLYPEAGRKDRHAPISEAHKNLAASLQNALEQSILNLAREAFEYSGIRNFCLAGGVALNCNTNSLILAQDFCDKIFVQAAANDGGVAMGAALYAASVFESSLSPAPDHVYLGPSFSEEEIRKVLDDAKVKYKRVSNIEQRTASLVAEGKIVGWFQGRMELGPRALVNRSIIADPSVPGMNDRVNEVKHREKWRPFAPAVTEEDGGAYFEGYAKSPFMLLTFYVKNEWRNKLPAITHVDGSSRIQSVNQEQNPRAYTLLREFEKLKGFPVLLNTSFNDAGEPIVMTPKDALKCFMSTPLDALAIGSFLLTK